MILRKAEDRRGEGGAPYLSWAARERDGDGMEIAAGIA